MFVITLLLCVRVFWCLLVSLSAESGFSFRTGRNGTFYVLGNGQG
jgi:hypothetical protein